MENRNSNLWIGLGIGSLVSALAYRFSRTSKAKRMKEKEIAKKETQLAKERSGQVLSATPKKENAWCKYQ